MRIDSPLLMLAITQLAPATGANLPSTCEPSTAYWVPIVAALIGAVSALATPFLKDLLITKFNERRMRNEAQREIFRLYTAPLAMSCEKLMWRFAEIFIDKRHHFLKSSTRPLIYSEYKRQSTLYRIACILGWIRAMQLELNSLPQGASGFSSPLLEAIKNVQSVLADGPDVELARLKQICALWGLTQVDLLDDTARRRLATDLEVKLYGLAGDALQYDSDALKRLDDDRKIAVCDGLARFLAAQFPTALLPHDVIAKTTQQAVAALSYREALIYRDWQEALGDAMLELDPDSERRFKLIGFQRFQELLQRDCPWIGVFRESILDIDLESIDGSDFRAVQLQKLALGAARILSSIAQSDDRDLVDDAILKVIEKLPRSA